MSTRIKILLGVLILILVGSLFYWYEIRPTRIMHACSWKKITLAAIPADPGISEKEAKIRSADIYKQCMEDKQKLPPPTSSIDRLIYNSSCGTNSVGYKAPTPEQPQKDIWKKTTKEEYAFCLHDKGLK